MAGAERQLASSAAVILSWGCSVDRLARFGALPTFAMSPPVYGGMMRPMMATSSRWSSARCGGAVHRLHLRANPGGRWSARGETKVLDLAAVVRIDAAFSPAEQD